MTSRKNAAGQAPSNIPALGPFETHVWQINLAETGDDEKELKDCIAPEDHDRASFFRFDRDRRSFVKRRAALRCLLASYVETSAKSIQLAFAPDKKPVLNGQSGPAGIRFSCSHSADYGLIAVARGRELGIDLERHRPLEDVMGLAKACFSEIEIAGLMKIFEPAKTRCFFDIWTRKEAFVKALGLGLSFPLKDFSVSLDQPAKLLQVKNEPNTVERWKMSSLDAPAGYSVTLVFDGATTRVQRYEWNFRSFNKFL